jgi:DNA-directed RNA polymerase subunit K/omega
MSSSNEVGIFMFNATSANKYPGTGVMESIHPEVKASGKFKELSKISEWRKALSNEYVVTRRNADTGLVIDEVMYPSIDHYCVEKQLIKNNDTINDTITEQCRDFEISAKNLKKRFKIKELEYEEDVLHKALLVKFSTTDNPSYTIILRETKDAVLTCFKRGSSTSVNNMAPTSLFTDILQCIRTHVITEYIKEFEESKRNAQLVSRDNKTDVLGNAVPNANGVEKNTKEDADNNTNAMGGSYHNSGSHDNNTTMECKILSKKEIENHDSFMSKYDTSKNKSTNRLTIYEKTNIVGVRMEQLAFGAQSYLDYEEEMELHSIKLIAHRELEKKRIPFILCRSMPNNTKEYWRLEDMHIV